MIVMVSRRKRLRRYFSRRQISLRVNVESPDKGRVHSHVAGVRSRPPLTGLRRFKQARRMSNPPQGYYAATAPGFGPAPRLAAKTRADLCIIGGGYTGLSAALHA